MYLRVFDQILKFDLLITASTRVYTFEPPALSLHIAHNFMVEFVIYFKYTAVSMYLVLFISLLRKDKQGSIVCVYILPEVDISHNIILSSHLLTL